MDSFHDELDEHLIFLGKQFFFHPSKVSVDYSSYHTFGEFVITNRKKSRAIKSHDRMQKMFYES